MDQSWEQQLIEAQYLIDSSLRYSDDILMQTCV